MILRAVVLGLCLAGCTNNPDPADATSSSSSSGSVSTSTAPSSSSADAGTLPSYTETEPNNAGAAGETNAVTFPATVRGAITPADDLDILRVTLAPGELWTWRLTSPGGVFAPHLSIVEETNATPVLLALAGAGGNAEQPHFVLQGGTYFLIVRDSRNVPSASSQHAGGADHTWQLSGTSPAAQPGLVELPSTTEASLATPFSIGLHQFQAAQGTMLDAVVNAVRRAPPSDMDTRLSLYDVTNRDWLITNDDDGTSRDSRVGGEMPTSGAYILIVDNINPAATVRDYSLVLTLR